MVTGTPSYFLPLAENEWWWYLVWYVVPPYGSNRLYNKRVEVHQYTGSTRKYRRTTMAAKKETENSSPLKFESYFIVNSTSTILSYSIYSSSCSYVLWQTVHLLFHSLYIRRVNRLIVAHERQRKSERRRESLWPCISIKALTGLKHHSRAKQQMDGVGQSAGLRQESSRNGKNSGLRYRH